MTDSTKDRIVRILSSAESPLREEGVALAVDHVLDEKLGRLVDVDRVREIVVQALTAPNVARVVERHVAPGFERYAAHVAKSEETVGGLVPDADAIRAIVDKSRLPRAKWADGMVDPALIRKLFAPVWANLLVSFAKRLPLPGMGTATGAAVAASSAVGRGVGGIAERIGRSVQERAEKIVDAGRSAMGGIGAEVEKRLHTAARDFSDGAAEVFREALADRLKSREGREIVGQISRQIVDHVLMTKLAELHVDVAALPMAEIFRGVPDILAHGARRKFVAELVEQEIAAFLAIEGDRTLRAVLDEMGIVEHVRDAAVRQASAILRDLFASDAFEGWLGRLLAHDG